MKSQALQLSIFNDMVIDYAVLQEKQKHLLAKKRRNGGAL